MSKRKQNKVRNVKVTSTSAPVPPPQGKTKYVWPISKPGKAFENQHIENKFHVVRRNIKLKHITVKHCGTESTVADIKMKALGVVKFACF